MIRSKPARQQDDAMTPAPGTERPTPLKAFLLGFLTNATNPKATLFFLAIFTTVVSEQTPLKIQALYGIWLPRRERD